jgi:AAA domain
MFDLKSISRTRRLEAPKILLAGEPKIGKSTFAACAPNAIGILTEDGLSGIDAQAFPLAKSLDDVYGAIGTLLNEEHAFQTVFIDSLDWLEPLVHAHVCALNKWDNIESPGYGKGYVAATSEWRNLLDGLEALRRERGMAVVLICHVKQQRIESPIHEGYDAMVLKLHAKAGAMVEEWVDIVGYAAHRIALKKTDAGFGAKENKAIKTGERMLYLDPHPAYPSGSRFGLHDCPLSWEAFADQLTQAQQPAALAA